MEEMTLGEWGALIVAVLAIIGGLFLAQSGAHGPGWAVVALGVIGAFWCIKRHFDLIERHRRQRPLNAGQH